MNGPYTVSAVSLGITAASGNTCGTGTARLRLLERKGTSEADRVKFVLVDGPVVPVVNTDPIAHANGVKLKLGFDATGVHVVINNVCE